MDLVKIGFQISADGLAKANKELDALLAKADKLNNMPVGVGGGNGGGKPRPQAKPPRDPELDALERKRKAIIELESLKTKYINQGFGKGASTQLAKMEISGADTSTLNKYQQALSLLL